MTVLEKIKRCVSLVWDFQEIYGEEDIEDFCRNELRTYPQHDEIMEYFKHIENLEKDNEWHNVKDGDLPKGEYPENEKVYAIFKNNSYYIVDRAAVKNYDDLIAWIELPKLPKEE